MEGTWRSMDINSRSGKLLLNRMYLYVMYFRELIKENTTQISFTENQYRPASATIFLSLKDAKETISDIFQVTVRVL